jgi:hypothetical protein
MNTLRRSLAVLLTSLPAHLVLAQGPLNPPGPPAATMKSLEQIDTRLDGTNSRIEQLDAKAEKRIPISDTTTPGNNTAHHVISEPGSYYLTGNLSVTKTHGIQVSAADVTVDLNGFQIRRVAGSGGIGVNIGTFARVTVRNGSITSSLSSPEIRFDVGVRALPAQVGGRYQDLRVSQCGGGILVGTNAIIDGCVVSDNRTTDGIRAGMGAVVTNCVAENNFNNGIDVGDSSTVSRCTATQNKGAWGIRTGNGSNISDCTARVNTSTEALSGGIAGGTHCTITRCTSSFNTSTNATANGSTGVGIYLVTGGMIKDCATSNNKGDGIQVVGDCLITGNHCELNGPGAGADGAGIHVTGQRARVEGNHVTNNDRGIDIDGPNNFIVRNTAALGGYDIVANNKVGPIVQPPNSGAFPPNPPAGVGTTDPWANFLY